LPRPGPSPLQPIVYSGRPLRLPGKCKRLEAALGAELLDRSVEPIQALTEKYPKVRVRLSSELTGELVNRLLAGNSTLLPAFAR